MSSIDFENIIISMYGSKWNLELSKNFLISDGYYCFSNDDIHIFYFAKDDEWMLETEKRFCKGKTLLEAILEFGK